jgi:hypothetical protein
MGIQSSIAAGALGLALVAGTGVEWRSLGEPARARFWFDSPTFQLPRSNEQLPGRLTTAEIQQIEHVARVELLRAFSGLRLEFSDHPRSPYQVRVVQDLPPRLGPRPLAAAESIALGPLGSQGWVSFGAVSGLAVSHAPRDADRATVLESIGRGLGGVAAHEFAHQILSSADLHASNDPKSYEYASADRQALFYGRLGWGLAEPLLADRLGTNDKRQITSPAGQTR